MALKNLILFYIIMMKGGELLYEVFNRVKICFTQGKTS